MRLFDIIANYPTKEKVTENIEISAITFDSREVKQGSMFFCLKGEISDGIDFANQAMKKGAVAIVSEQPLKLDGVVFIYVEDARHALAYFSACFYNNPEKKLKIIGVVGTNGKTSTCHILKDILSFSNKKTAVIGTLGVRFENFFKPLELTTPDPIELFLILNQLVEMGAEYVAMEVSAHAIFYKKTQGIVFSALIFTNCTQDHLDFFKTFEQYEKVKLSIFQPLNANNFIINSDDVTGRKLLDGKNVYSFAIHSPSDVFAVNIFQEISGVEFVLNIFDKLYRIRTNLLGEFNIYNILAAATCCRVLGIKSELIASSLNTLSPIVGRMERVADYKGASIFVDYAHTPDGLKKSIDCLRRVTKGRLICLFGCGGNRDKSKRGVMGKIAGSLCDFVIITSDNPRFEEPLKIITEIEQGLREVSLNYISIPNREEAISYALERLSESDSLLIAGKGAEQYQDIMGVKQLFCDKDRVLNIIKDG